MEMMIDFPGGTRVDAHFGLFTVETDQPPDATAPTPFALFLASLGTCAGIYILGFCRQRGISTDGIRLIQRAHRIPSNGLIGKVELEIQVPESFPKRYLSSLVRSAELCAVKKHLDQPPQFKIYTQAVQMAEQSRN